MNRLVRSSLPVLLLSVTLGATADAQMRTSSVRIDYVHETLPNGLNVIYHVDRNAPIVAVNTWYSVGSKHEQIGRTGLAHLYEHIMLFKGSRNVRDQERFALLEQAGGRAGPEINGTTSFDRTNYFQQVPSNQLELALWIEADHMRTAGEALTIEAVNAQREIVKNERRQSTDNQPYGSWVEKMIGHAFPTAHPYSHHVLGSMQDLSAQTLQDVKTFFSQYYSPDNAVMVVAGDIDIGAAKALVRKHFSTIPRGLPRPALRSTTVPTTLSGPKREVVNDANARTPAVYMGHRVPAQRAKEAAAIPLLAAVLGSGRTSHLFSTLVRERQAATSAGAFSFGLVEGADILIATAVGRPGANPDSLEKALSTALDSAVAAITPEQLARVKASVRFQFVNGLQTMGGFGGRADRLAEGQTFYGNADWVNRRLAELDAVTLEQLQTAASTYLRPNNRVTLVFVPAAQNAPKSN
ncbi:MAG: insulinase family protein [Gemmatimonadota bacterium]|nr:insulinase family protein [Gemmatimonadota bacterium]